MAKQSRYRRAKILELVSVVLIALQFSNSDLIRAFGEAGLMATLIALRFWELPQGHERFMAENAFFEHLGLCGGFLLVAWHDLKGDGKIKWTSR